MRFFNLFKKDIKNADKNQPLDFKSCPWEVDSSSNVLRNLHHEENITSSKDPTLAEIKENYKQAYLKEKRERELESRRNDEIVDLFRWKVKDLERNRDRLNNMLGIKNAMTDALRQKVNSLERNNDSLRNEMSRLSLCTFRWNANAGAAQSIYRQRLPSCGEALADLEEESPELFTPDLTKISSSNEDMNVTLVLGDKSVTVSKDLLALHSPVFATMFYGKFMEGGKREVEIKDVVYEEFIDLLSLLYSRRAKLSDSTVCHVLDLADRFQITNIIDEAEQYLIESKVFSVSEQKQLAERYRLNRLMVFCCHRFF